MQKSFAINLSKGTALGTIFLTLMSPAFTRVSQEADGGTWIPAIVATCFIQDSNYMNAPFGKYWAPILEPHLDEARAGLTKCKAEISAANPQIKNPVVGVPKAMCDTLMSKGFDEDFISGEAAGKLYDQHATDLKWLSLGGCSKKQTPTLP